MLSPEIIKKIKKVHIKSGRLVNTLMAGQYKSVFRGSGIEFEEVREYSPGDDVKSIDWKVSARMGRPYIKLFREERELIVMLLVDMSASGRFGTTDALKQDTAVEIASILAFNAIRNNDKVGAILFTDRVEKYIPPQKGAGHVWRVIKEMYTFSPEHTGTDINEAVGFMGRVCRKKSVAFVISDFLHSGRAVTKGTPFRMVSRKHELISVLVSDPGEFRLPDAGIVYIQDLENGRCRSIDASDPSTRQQYEQMKRTEYQNVTRSLKSLNIDCIEVPTDGSAADALTGYFRMRERRKR
ncbi:MAG: DUF58 domain-containing protein [Desulfobacteraceae bacterium]|nr:DUF58 domain-containing protein [Desulfobacteraceae bacterium]